MQDAGALDRLAAHYGIEPWFRDNWGERRVIPAETKRALLEVWGPAQEHATHYLRIYIGRHLRQKLGDDPTRPRYITNEPRVGYRLLDGDEEAEAAPTVPDRDPYCLSSLTRWTHRATYLQRAEACDRGWSDF